MNDIDAGGPKVYVYEDAPGWTAVVAQDENGETVRRVDARTELFDEAIEVRAAQDCLMRLAREPVHEGWSAHRRDGHPRPGLQLVTE